MPSKELDRQRRMLQQIATNGTSRPRLEDEPTGHPDVSDLAAVSHAQYISEVKEQIHMTVPDAARRALERLAKGQYGICRDCGRPISPKRLAAVPWTECCVHCQTERENEYAFKKAA